VLRDWATLVVCSGSPVPDRTGAASTTHLKPTSAPVAERAKATRNSLHSHSDPLSVSMDTRTPAR